MMLYGTDEPFSSAYSDLSKPDILEEKVPWRSWKCAIVMPLLTEKNGMKDWMFPIQVDLFQFSFQWKMQGSVSLQ